MIKFAVYQPTLTDAQVEALNAAGSWSAKPEFAAYADVTTGTFRDGDDPVVAVEKMVNRAISYFLFNHVAFITAERLEAVWVIGNQRPHEMIEEVGVVPMKSISVGDILVNQATNEAWFCNRRGWTPLPANTLRVLRELSGLGVDA